MCVGQDDGGGLMSPQYGMILRALKNCVVKDNTLNIGALKETLRDLGGHEDGVVIEDKVGSVFDAPGGESIWSSGRI